jgi:hypothetical protein
MSKRARSTVVVAVMLLVPLGIVALVVGWIPKGFSLNLAQVATVAIGILIVGHLLFHPQPEADNAMEKLRQRQAQQASQFEDLAQILPHLLPESQRAHLLRLRNEAAADYQGTPALRGDLRRLCAMGLVRPKIGRRIRQITDGAAVDLADYVELTPLGAQWVESVLVIERAERPAAGRSGGEDRSEK